MEILSKGMSVMHFLSFVMVYENILLMYELSLWKEKKWEIYVWIKLGSIKLCQVKLISAYIHRDFELISKDKFIYFSYVKISRDNIVSITPIWRPFKMCIFGIDMNINGVDNTAILEHLSEHVKLEMISQSFPLDFLKKHLQWPNLPSIRLAWNKGSIHRPLLPLTFLYQDHKHSCKCAVSAEK